MKNFIKAMNKHDKDCIWKKNPKLSDAKLREGILIDL
jgi:hypothetical protein